MVLTRAMQKRRANTGVEATNNETPTAQARDSRDSHSVGNIQTNSRDSTVVFSNEAEDSVNVHGNTFSTTTGSHGAQQTYNAREDQSSLTGPTSSNTQTAHVGKTKRKRNAEVLDSQPQASGSSTEGSQDPREDLPDASFAPPPKPKSRKRRGHGWTRKKTRRGATQGRAVRVGGKRPVECVDGEEDEARPMKRRHISEEAAAWPSNARSISLDNTIGATNVRQLQSRSIDFPEGPANSGREERSRTTRSASPPCTTESSMTGDLPAIGIDFAIIKMEEEEGDCLWDTPPPSDWSRPMLEIELESAVTCEYDRARSTPELMTGGNGCHRDESESVGSTPIRTPRAQSLDVKSFDRSLMIVLPGMMEEAATPDELMVIRDEDKGNVSISSIPVDRRRSRAPSPPSRPPSLPVSRQKTPERGKESDLSSQTMWEWIQ